MARSLAKVQVTIWQSDDWRGLPTAAQWLYFVLLTQSRLSLAGCTDLVPSRWSALSPDMTEDCIAHALEVLERGRYVAADRSTGEVCIRTFTTHDLAAGTLNVNLVKGFWSAWSGILSADLRHYVVENLPAKVWDWPGADHPEEAERFRTSPRLEPQFEPWSEPQTEPSLSSSFSSSASVTATEPVASTVDEKLTAAARLLAAAEIERRGPTTIGNHEGYTKSRLPQLTQQNADRWRAMLDADPSMTPEQLAAPPVTASTTPEFRQHEESVVAASEARYLMAEKVRTGQVCGTCRGTGQYLPDDADTMALCPCRERN
jgi:hypothetical protein